MQLTTQQLNDIKKIKRRLNIAPILSRLGYIGIVLAFVCYLFAKDYVPFCLIAAMILLSHTLFNDDIKQLLNILDRFSNDEAENIIRAAEVDTF